MAHQYNTIHVRTRWKIQDRRHI